MLKSPLTLSLTLLLGLGTATTLAASISSLDCTAPSLVVTFDASVAETDASVANSGLTALKFKETTSSGNSVSLSHDVGDWNADRTEYTTRPTRQDYKDTFGWDVWTLAVEATADGSTSTLACN